MPIPDGYELRGYADVGYRGVYGVVVSPADATGGREIWLYRAGRTVGRRGFARSEDALATMLAGMNWVPEPRKERKRARPTTKCPHCGHGASAHVDTIYSGPGPQGSVGCRTCLKARGITMSPVFVAAIEGECQMTKRDILRDLPHRYSPGNFEMSVKCLVCEGLRDDPRHSGST